MNETRCKVKKAAVFRCGVKTSNLNILKYYECKGKSVTELEMKTTPCPVRTGMGSTMTEVMVDSDGSQRLGEAKKIINKVNTDLM